MSFITQDRVVLFAQQNGSGTPMQPLSLDKNGMADKVHPGPGRTPVFGRDAFGRFFAKIVQTEPPGGLNTSTIEEDGTGVISFLSKQFERFGCFPIQERYIKCGRLDGPNYDELWHYGKMTITQKTHGAGPSREATGAAMFDSFDVTWPYTVELVKHGLSNLTVSENQNINDIAVLGDLVGGCGDCFPGYAPDTIIYLAPAANAGSPGDYANVWYSINGGGAFAATSTNPFAAADNILAIAIWFISDTQFRVIVLSGATTLHISYSDFTLGDEGTSSWSTAETIATGAPESMAWLFYNRLYVAVVGDIYLSQNQGDSFGTALYTGTAAINGFAKNWAGDVWAFGASNTILLEKNQSGTFDTKVGPSGGGAFTALFEANDGIVYAGNGTKLYKSTNKALNTGGWELVKEFGANKSVVAINCAGGDKTQGGDSQLIRVVVDDTAGGVGAVWESVDGGASFTQVTALTNTGYNAAYFSGIDDNLAFVVGDAGIVQKLSPLA